LSSEFGAPLPTPENHGATASRISNGVPGRQSELNQASRKMDSGTARLRGVGKIQNAESKTQNAI